MNQVEINKDMKLSQHFTLGELTKTSYHTSDGNIPSHVAIENLRRLCVEWLELLRERYNLSLGPGPNDRSDLSTGPDPSDRCVIINSGYRSEEVNMKCGGAKNSNHLTGCAVDIRCDGPEQMIRYAAILLDIDNEKSHNRDRSCVPTVASEQSSSTHCENFDELILEKRGTTYWIHFAVRPKDNRRKILFDCR